MLHLLTFPALAWSVWALGRLVARRIEPSGGDAAPPPVPSWLAGFLLLYLLLQALYGLGIPWQPWILAPLLLAGALAGLRGRAPAITVPWRAIGPGGLVALGALAVFVVCTLLLSNLHADFIFHWGIKAQKFHLARGFDFEYLAWPWNQHVHPDYPNLLPALYATTAILGGGFREVPMALWSAVFFGLALLSARDLLLRLGASRFAAQAATALVGLVLAMFGVGYLQAGGADLGVALAVLAGTAALARPPGRAADIEIGLVAAFAAALKIEGIPLAAFLLLCHLGRRLAHDRGALLAKLPRVLPRAAGPALVTVGIWAYQTTHHSLFQAGNTGTLRWDRLGLVAGELWSSLGTVNWHGFPYLLLALPLLLAWRRGCWIAALCLLQAAFYVYAYLSTPLEPQQLIATSAARLMLHLVPTVLVVLVAGMDRGSREASVG